PFAERFGIDYDLMFLIDHGHPVVALDHPMAGRHLGALGIGDIALALVTTGTDVLLAGFQKILNLFDLSLVGGQFLVVLSTMGLNFSLSSLSRCRATIFFAAASYFCCFLLSSSWVPLHSLEAFDASLHPSMAKVSLLINSKASA